MDWAPDVRFCEVFVNGDYRGLYLMTECIDGDRLDLSYSKDHVELFGYLLKIDRKSEDDLGTVRNITTFSESSGLTENELIIRYPGRYRLTEAMSEAIRLDYSEFEASLYLNGDYEGYIDIDSFVDYYIINEFTANLDAGIYSTYIYKQPDGKLKLCVWDFNNSCDNYTEQATSPAGLYMCGKLYYSELLKDSRFAERVIKRYYELRKTCLSDEYLESFVLDTLEYLGSAAERNNSRWSESLTDWAPLKPAERNPENSCEAVAQLLTWLRERGAWLDENITTLTERASTRMADAMG